MGTNNVKIIINGENDGKPVLFTRRLIAETVYAQNATAYKPETTDRNTGVITQAVEAKEAIAYKAPEWDYRPFNVEFKYTTETQSYTGTNSSLSGKEIFSKWLAEPDTVETLGSKLGLAVEKETKGYNVTANFAQTGSITPEMVEEHELEDESDIENFVMDNSYLVDFEDDGNVSDIEISEDYTDFLHVEWE